MQSVHHAGLLRGLYAAAFGHPTVEHGWFVALVFLTDISTSRPCRIRSH
jgi:hypothetical protein